MSSLGKRYQEAKQLRRHHVVRAVTSMQRHLWRWALAAVAAVLACEVCGFARAFLAGCFLAFRGTFCFRGVIFSDSAPKTLKATNNPQTPKPYTPLNLHSPQKPHQPSTTPISKFPSEPSSARTEPLQFGSLVAALAWPATVWHPGSGRPSTSDNLLLANKGMWH